MAEFIVPRWFYLYLRIYGVFHIVLGLILLAFSNLNLLLPLFMIIAGVSALIRKRWGVFPITVMALLVTAFYMTIVIPFGFGEKAYAFALEFTFLLAAELFTAVLYWRFIFHR